MHSVSSTVCMGYQTSNSSKRRPWTECPNAHLFNWQLESNKPPGVQTEQTCNWGKSLPRWTHVRVARPQILAMIPVWFLSNQPTITEVPGHSKRGVSSYFRAPNPINFFQDEMWVSSVSTFGPIRYVTVMSGCEVIDRFGGLVTVMLWLLIPAEVVSLS